MLLEANMLAMPSTSATPIARNKRFAASSTLPAKKTRHAFEEKENMKLQILRVRLQKEELECDIMRLNKRDKEIDVQMKEIEFKKYLRENNLSDTDSD